MDHRSWLAVAIIMYVQGYGDHRQRGREREWRDALTETAGSGDGLDAFTYDQICERTEISFTETLDAFSLLAGSTIGLTHRGPGLDEMTDCLRWTAGYVGDGEGFQAETLRVALGE